MQIARKVSHWHEACELFCCPPMRQWNKNQIENYMRSALGRNTEVCDFKVLGTDPKERSLKSYGYGTPVRIEYRDADNQKKNAVLHTISPGPFGHEFMSDRAQELLWEHTAFNRLPRHVRSLDVGGIRSDGIIVPLGDVEEFCLLTGYASGQGYFLDLERLRDGGELRALDVARADALCDYLVEIHRVRGADAGLYVRRIRELVGGSECIMGLIDSYDSGSPEEPGPLQKIEQLCVEWRWMLKKKTGRLREVHGDFHPWNILFQDGADFCLLDRSRGEYGDPADDVACLTANYLFFSLQRSGTIEGSFKALFERFWNRYLERSRDHEILEVIAPFYVFRALVMASPLWYPNLPSLVRQRLFSFMRAVLEEERFHPDEVNEYCDTSSR